MEIHRISGGAGSDLLKSLLAGRSNDDDASASTLAQDVQVSLLNEAFKSLSTEHNFKPGQLIQRKSGVSTGSSQDDAKVSVFIAYVDRKEPPTNLETVTRPWAVSNSDCVVGRVMPNGSVCEWYENSRYFEPFVVA
jgi:hypothetical protein